MKAAGIVVQMGTQVRSFSTSTGCRELFQSGVARQGLADRAVPQRRQALLVLLDGAAEDVKEEDVDWKEFLMDRPMRPFDGKLLTGWYGYREFSDGPIANLGCHFIDLFNYIVGTKFPTSCVARAAPSPGRTSTTSPAPTTARPSGSIPRASWSATRPTSATAAAAC